VASDQIIVSSMKEPMVVPLDTDEYWADPYPVLAELRERHRTAVTPAGEKVVLRWDDAVEVKKRPQFENEGLEFIEARGFRPGDPLYEWRRWSIGARNGADHRRLRSLVNRALTPKSADAIRSLARERTRAVLEEHSADGELDARTAFRHVPFLAITHFLGIDVEEATRVGSSMGSGGANAFGPNVTQEIRDQANNAFGAVMEFVGQLVDQRRAEPRDDLLTRLIAAEEDGQRLSRDELIVLFTNIFSGAIETTSSLMTSIVLELARHPDQRELLRDEPDELKRGAVEEVLRHRPGFYATGQKATAPVDVAGLHFEADEPLSIIIGGPNRDPAHFEDPDRFDIMRDPNAWSFTFSMGQHFCLGQALARAELQEFAACIATHCEDLELTAEPKWQPRVMVNSVDRCPVRYAYR
jgi:cytochrome P450